MEWTPEEIAQLKILAKEKTYDELSIIFNRSSVAIRAKVRSLGIQKGNPKNRSQDQRQAIVRCFNEIGLPATAEKYKISKDVVWSIVWQDRQRTKKNASGVPVERAERLRSRALGYAYTHGLESHAEDFASYCVLRLYEGRQSDVKYMAVDYKREYFGDIRSKNGMAQVRGSFNPVEIGEGDEDDCRVDPGAEDARIRIFEMIKAIDLEGVERVCFVLHTVFGLRNDEIALCLGVDPTRISQILCIAKSIIQRKNAKGP